MHSEILTCIQYWWSTCRTRQGVAHVDHHVALDFRRRQRDHQWTADASLLDRRAGIDSRIRRYVRLGRVDARVVLLGEWVVW